MFYGSRRIEALEASVQRLAGKLAVTEVLYATIAALTLRATPDAVRDAILRELRASVTVSVKGLAMPSDAEMLTLQLEENVARSLDQIEHIVRFSLGAADSPRPSSG